MAYYLQLDGINDRVRCPIPPDVDSDWELRFRARSGGDTVGAWVEDNGLTSFFAITPTNEINIQSRNTLVQLTHNVDITDGFHLYTLKYKDGVLTARIDGVTMGTTTGITSFSWDLSGATHFNIGASYRATGTVSHSDMDFDFFEIWHNGEPIRRWDSSASNGTGSQLTETFVGGHGTLLNFPTDDSQWVYVDNETVNPAEYARKVNLTGLSPQAPLTGYVALITEDNVPAEFWSIAQYGGGDVRVTLNTDGTGQLPIEVAVCDTVGQKLRVFARFTNYTDLERGCWLFYGKPGERLHARTSQYGQYSVWQDHWLVVHGLTNLNDSTGNDWDPMIVLGSPVPSLDKGILLTNGIKLDYDTPNLGVTDLSVMAIAQVDWFHGLIIGSGSIRGATVFTTRAIGANNSPTLVMTLDGNTAMNTGFIADGDSLAAGSDSTQSHGTGTDFAIAGTVDRDGSGGKLDGTWIGYDDGQQSAANNVGLGNKSLGSNAFTGRVSIGRHPEWGNESSVNIKYLQVAKETFPPEKVLLSQTNQKNPDTFWVTGIPEDAPLPVSSDVNVSFVVLGVGSATSDSSKDSPNTYSFGSLDSITSSSIKEVDTLSYIDSATLIESALLKEISDTFILSSVQSINSTESKQGFNNVTAVSTTSSQVTISKQTDTSQIIESTNNITVYVGSLLLVDITMAVSNSSSITTSSSKGISQNISSTNNTTLTSSWSIDKSLSSAVANGVYLTASQTKRLPVILNSSSATSYDALHELSKSVSFDVSSMLNNTQAIEIQKAIDTLYQGNSSILVYLDTDQARHIAISMQLVSSETLTSSEIINKLSQIDNILAASSLSTVSNKALEQSINYSLVSELSAEFILTKKVALGLTSTSQILPVVSKNTDTEIENDSVTTLLMQQTASRVAQTNSDISSISSTVLEIDVDKSTAYVLNSDTDSSIEIYFNKKLNAIQIATDSSITTVLNPEGSDSLKNIIKVPVVTKIETHNISDTTVVNPTVVQELTIVHDSVVPIRTTVLGGD